MFGQPFALAGFAVALRRRSATPFIPTLVGLAPVSVSDPYEPLVFDAYDLIGLVSPIINSIDVIIDDVIVVAGGVSLSPDYALVLAAVSGGYRVTVFRTNRYWRAGDHVAKLSAANGAGRGFGTWTWTTRAWATQDIVNCTPRDLAFIGGLL